MTGQKELLSRIDQLIGQKKFPRFSIISGMPLSGKKTVAKYIANKAGFNPSIIDGGVESIREMIQTAYTVSVPVLYIIPNAEKLSQIAVNSLLKVIEEPPLNAYFVLTTSALSDLLPTIRSRAQVFTIAGYTRDEIRERAVASGADDNAIHVCETIGDVELYVSQGESFYSDVVKVYENIMEVSGANALKIPKMLKLTAEGEGYDLRLFWTAFIHVCMTHLSRLDIEWALITADARRESHIKGANLAHIVDVWILNIRRAGIDYAVS